MTIYELAAEINSRLLYHATVDHAGVMKVTRGGEARTCERCAGTGHVNDAGETVADQVVVDGETVTITSAGISAVIDASAWLRSLHS